MSNVVYIQPSELECLGNPGPGGWVRGIPTPGVPIGPSPAIPAIPQIATCENLVQDSPPTLLEEYGFYSYSIGVSAITGAGDTAPDITIELAILINGTIRYVTDTGPITAQQATAPWIVSGSFVSDFVNDIVVGARDRLGLRLGFSSTEGLQEEDVVIVGVQVETVANAVPFPSTISYNTTKLPASHRL